MYLILTFLKEIFVVAQKNAVILLLVVVLQLLFFIMVNTVGEMHADYG